MSKRTQSNEVLIAALLQNPTVSAAAKSCGTTSKTLYIKLRDSDFKAAYDAARRDVVRTAVCYMQSVTGEAIATLRDIMLDPDSAQQVKINAADAILRNAHKFTESLDVLEQLAELKEAIHYDEH